MGDVVFSPDGKTLAVGTGEPLSSEGASLQLVDVWSCRTRQEFRVEGAVWRVSFLPGGRELASVEARRTQWGTFDDGTPSIHADADVLRYFDCSTGRPRGTQRVDVGRFSHVLAVSPDGRTALVRAGGREYLWDTEARRVGRRLPGMTRGGGGSQEAKRAAFSPDGRYLAECGSPGEGPGGAYMLWDVHSSRVVRMVPTDYSALNDRQSGGEFLDDDLEARDARTVAFESTISEVTFSQDGSLLVSSGWRVAVRHTATGRLRHLLNVEARHAAFLADGRLLAVYLGYREARDPALRLYDLQQRKCIRRWNAHETRIDAMAASPDGTLLATGATDGDDLRNAYDRCYLASTIKLWRLADLAETD